MQQVFLDYLVGVPLNSLLATHGLSKTTFYRQLKQINIPQRESNRFFPLQLIQMKLDYEAGETIKSIASKYDSTEITVSKALRSVGTRIRTTAEVTRRYSVEEEEKATEKYLSGISAANAGPSEATVLRWLKDRGIKARQQPAYGGDLHFFRSLDTEHSLYWFGFLCADGSVADGRYVKIDCAYKDQNHLELFKKHLCYSKPLKFCEAFNKKRQKLDKWVELAVGSVEMVRDLRRHGILEVKAGNPNPLIRLTDEQLRVFIRGYFDGDGSIYLVKPKNKPSWLRWYICCQHKAIPEYLMSRCPVVDRWNAVWAGTTWRVEFGGNLVVPKICEWLYRAATVYLGRKKRLADSILVPTCVS